MCCSKSKSHDFKSSRGLSPPKPLRVPSDPITRWHGTIKGNLLRDIVCVILTILRNLTFIFMRLDDWNANYLYEVIC